MPDFPGVQHADVNFGQLLSNLLFNQSKAIRVATRRWCAQSSHLRITQLGVRMRKTTFIHFMQIMFSYLKVYILWLENDSWAFDVCRPIFIFRVPFPSPPQPTALWDYSIERNSYHPRDCRSIWVLVGNNPRRAQPGCLRLHFLNSHYCMVSEFG